MARPDDHDENSPERDWDRNVSSVLAELRSPADATAPPTLDPTLDVPAGDRDAQAWKSRGGLRLMGLFALLGCVLLVVAFWPQGDAASQAAAGPRAPAAAEARLGELEAALSAERARTLRLEARVDALEGRLDAAETQREQLAERHAELERDLAAQRTIAVEAARAAAPRREAAGPGSSMQAPSPSAPGDWTVSLMTLSSRATAEAYAQDVRAQGWRAEVTETGSRGGFWRVSSGDFATRADAEAHAATVAGALRLDSVWVTRRERR